MYRFSEIGDVFLDFHNLMKFKPIFKFIFLIGFIFFVLGLILFFLSGWRVSFHRFKNINYISDQNSQLRLVGSVTKPKMNTRGNVLFLHGSSVFGRKLPLYRMLIKNLSKDGYEVASYDFRGYGESDNPKKMNFSEFDLQKDVVLIINTLEWEAYHIIGHSLGASIAMNIAAKGKIDGALSIISIGPSRRVYERMLMPDANNFEYARKRFQTDMLLKQKFDGDLIRFFCENTNIDNALEYFKNPDHCPLFLIDGELEDKKDLDYLRNYYSQIVNPKSYYTVPSSNHYCKVVSFFTRNKITRSLNWDIIVYKKKIFENMFDQILSWLDMFVQE